MTVEGNVLIQQYEFNKQAIDNVVNNHHVKDLWPVVYILSDDKVKEAYVGETTDTYARLGTHLKNPGKKKLTSVHLISSSKFNKSATLDIESNLIKYMSADGQFDLINANLGIANHNYYQKKEIYWDIFNEVWNELRSKGITKHSIEYIDNSDLFKYSPYKSLTPEQSEGLKQILNCILNDKYENIIIEGGAGTGKTILAIFVFKLLASDHSDFDFREFGEEEIEFVELVKAIKKKMPNPKMGLVIPMSSFRGTLQRVFKNIKGLKANMVIGPADVTKGEFDILLVDEAHRLRKKKSIGAYIGAFNNAAERLGLDPDKTNELEWVLKQSKKSVIFYDQDQSIKPSDVDKIHFDELKEKKNTIVKQLKSQFRVLGGNDYVEFIDKLLWTKLPPQTDKFNAKNYELFLFGMLHPFFIRNPFPREAGNQS
jgi:hypothetical protein